MNCTSHPDVPASYRCDGCGRLMCTECVEEGHRLLTCGECGEIALAIAETAAATPARLARQRAIEKPYSLLDAFVYVFRGQGLYVFGSYLGALAVLALVGIVPVVGAIACLVTLVFVLLVLFLVPGALFKITRTTAEGKDELPDWPDFGELGDRAREVFDFLVIGVIAGLPLAGLLRVAGCTGWATLPAHCWLALVVGWFLALVLWVPAFGAVAVFREGWLAIRLDLHLRAVVRGGADLLVTALLATGLVVFAQVLAVLLAALPLVGLIAAAAAGTYGWFTAAHLVGLFCRRRSDLFDELYG